MKKIAFILPLFAIALTSCSTNNKVIESKVFCFDTLVEAKLYDGKKENIQEVEKILNNISDLTEIPRSLASEFICGAAAPFEQDGNAFSLFRFGDPNDRFGFGINGDRFTVRSCQPG